MSIDEMLSIVSEAIRTQSAREFRVARASITTAEKPKQAWQLLNHTLGRTKMNKTQPSTIMVDGKLTFSPDSKASGFNEFFSSVGKNLAEKIPSVVPLLIFQKTN
eukprot:Lithocolla_globosa_v1_NODE_97_length_6435_cov_22.188927.p3 type:complete len:105 gc:universal NODE_97_length_6435_cov_22.188927:5927-5613(-)